MGRRVGGRCQKLRIKSSSFRTCSLRILCSPHHIILNSQLSIPNFPLRLSSKIRLHINAKFCAGIGFIDREKAAEDAVAESIRGRSPKYARL